MANAGAWGVDELIHLLTWQSGLGSSCGSNWQRSRVGEPQSKQQQQRLQHESCRHTVRHALQQLLDGCTTFTFVSQRQLCYVPYYNIYKACGLLASVGSCARSSNTYMAGPAPLLWSCYCVYYTAQLLLTSSLMCGWTFAAAD